MKEGSIVSSEIPTHDESGRFAKGNKAGAGRLVRGKGNIDHIDPCADVRDLSNLLPQLTSLQDVADVWDAVKTKAKNGDMKAAQIVLERLGGKASRSSAVEVDLFERFAAMADRYRAMRTDNIKLSEPNTNDGNV